jgi:hypothetical protein
VNLLTFAIITMSVIIVSFSASPLSLQQLPLQNVFAQDDESQTGIEQRLGQKNLGSGESTNFNCADNTIEGSPSSLSLCQTAEPPEEEPPQEESATLFVCKEVEDPNQQRIPSDFEFIVTGPGQDIQFPGGPIGDPDPDCPPGSGQPGDVVPGEFEIMETMSSQFPPPDSIVVEGDCIQDPTNPRIATVEIQEGETLTCTFTNIYELQGIVS